MTHYYRIRRYRPELHNQPCRIITRGKRNSILIEFESGERHVVSRWAVRKLK